LDIYLAIVDRGPDSPRGLEFFRTHPRARSLMGHHECKHLRSFAGEIPPARSQQITRHQLGYAYPAAVAFVETFPTSFDLPEATLVHGFWPPGRALADQAAKAPDSKPSAKIRSGAGASRRSCTRARRRRARKA